MIAQALLLLGLVGCVPTPAERQTGGGQQFLIVDADATQPGVAGFPGVVWRFDEATGALTTFCADPRLRDPQRIARAADDTYLLIDFEADPTRRGSGGALFHLAADGHVVAVTAPDCLVAPTSLVIVDGTTVYVTDRRARPHKDGAGQGAVFALDPGTGACRTLCADDRFRAPADLIALPGGDLLVLDADARAADAADGEEGVLFRIDARTGEVRETWPLRGTISPLGMLAEADGDLLLFDVNADPLHIGGPLGAIFRFSWTDHSTALVCSKHAFRDPVRGCRNADDVWFVDANADPLKRGPDAVGRGQNVTGGGALFRLDPRTGEVTLVAAPAGLVNPVDVLRLR